MEEIINTTAIQAESLRLFMAQLGYRPWRGNGGWITDNPAMSANRTLSTKTAIGLHNRKRKDWVEVGPGWYGLPDLKLRLVVTAYGLNLLNAAKLVKEIKLQPSRRATNGLVMPPDALAHLIKIKDEKYWALFGLKQS